MTNFQTNSFIASIPVVTRNILVINVIVWLACFVFERTSIDLSGILGLHFPQSEGFYAFQFITYMFTHVSFTHLFFNMFALFMFGKILEYDWGGKRLLIYYMVTGIGAAIVQLLVGYIRIRSLCAELPDNILQDVQSRGYNLLQESMNYSDEPLGSLNLLFNSVTIGASGSVFGILLAFGMSYPNTPLYLMFVPIPIKAKYFVMGYGLIELFLGVSNRSGDNVAHFAHLGGMIFGLILLLCWSRNNRFTEKTKRWFKRFKKKKDRMHVGYNRFESEYEYNRKKNESNEEVNRILDKIKKSGYGSLTNEEKKKLFDACEH